MAADEPPYLTVGTDVSAKYKGAFCEAKIKKVMRIVKCKVTFKNNLGAFMVTDDQIKGPLRIGADIDAKHPEKNQFFEGVINKLQDYSQYTVVFDDGDETTLRRTSLCLKSGRHFAESPTLDQFPLTNPEHFGTPVIGAGKFKRKRRSTMNSSLDYDGFSSEEEETKGTTRKLKGTRGSKDRDVGKVVSVDFGDRRKKDNWYPAITVLHHSSQINVKVNKDEVFVRSFKDGKYYAVPKKDVRDFSKECILKIENNALKAATEKAIVYLEKEELPPHWDKVVCLPSLDQPASATDDTQDSDSDSSDDEPSEEKDRFVAQLYKFMDERGTPINKAPTVSNKDLNLYKLFKIMHKLGGYNKVTNKNKWKIVYSKMGLPQSNVNGPNQIKFAYKRYLQSFEDFYRKLGCTMVSNSRTTRGRHRSDRNFIVTRTREKDAASPKSRTMKEAKEKVVIEKKPEVKVKVAEKKEEEDKSKAPEKKKPERPARSEDKEEKKKREEKPRLVRSQSLNKDKKDVKEEAKPEKARTREDARKEKNESPEKKGTRSSSKIDAEKKEESPKEKEKIVKEKEEKPVIIKDVKDDKAKLKKEEKPPVERKSRGDKKPEEKVVRRKDNSREERTPRAKKKEEVKEEKSIPKKKPDRLVKEKKEEKPTRAKPEEKLVAENIKKPTEEEEKTVKEEKKSEVEVKKDSETGIKEKLRPKRQEGGPMSEDDGTEGDTSRDSFDKKETDEPPNKGRRRFMKSDDKEDKESLFGMSDSDESSTNDSERYKDVKHSEIEVGDRVKVKYGRGRMQKVYEAKVLKIESDGQDRRYFVHYAGWNTRYDEWVRKNYIVAIINGGKHKQDSINKYPLSGPGKKLEKICPPGGVRKNSTSSTNSSCSRATRRGRSSPPPPKRTRQGAMATDLSQGSDTDDPMDDLDDEMDEARGPPGFKEELFSDDEEKEKMEDVKREGITELEKAILVEDCKNDLLSSEMDKQMFVDIKRDIKEEVKLETGQTESVIHKVPSESIKTTEENKVEQELNIVSSKEEKLCDRNYGVIKHSTLEEKFKLKPVAEMSISSTPVIKSTSDVIKSTSVVFSPIPHRLELKKEPEPLVSSGPSHLVSTAETSFTPSKIISKTSTSTSIFSEGSTALSFAGLIKKSTMDKCNPEKIPVSDKGPSRTSPISVGLKTEQGTKNIFHPKAVFGPILSAPKMSDSTNLTERFIPKGFSNIFSFSVKTESVGDLGKKSVSPIPDRKVDISVKTLPDGKLAIQSNKVPGSETKKFFKESQSKPVLSPSKFGGIKTEVAESKPKDSFDILLQDRKPTFSNESKKLSDAKTSYFSLSFGSHMAKDKTSGPSQIKSIPPPEPKKLKSADVDLSKMIPGILERLTRDVVADLKVTNSPPPRTEELNFDFLRASQNAKSLSRSDSSSSLRICESDTNDSNTDSKDTMPEAKLCPLLIPGFPEQSDKKTASEKVPEIKPLTDKLPKIEKKSDLCDDKPYAVSTIHPPLPLVPLSNQLKFSGPEKDTLPIKTEAKVPSLFEQKDTPIKIESYSENKEDIPKQPTLGSNTSKVGSTNAPKNKLELLVDATATVKKCEANIEKEKTNIPVISHTEVNLEKVPNVKEEIKDIPSPLEDVLRLKNLEEQQKESPEDCTPTVAHIGISIDKDNKSLVMERTFEIIKTENVKEESKVPNDLKSDIKTSIDSSNTSADVFPPSLEVTSEFKTSSDLSHESIPESTVENLVSKKEIKKKKLGKKFKKSGISESGDKDERDSKLKDGRNKSKKRMKYGSGDRIRLKSLSRTKKLKKNKNKKSFLKHEGLFDEINNKNESKDNDPKDVISERLKRKEKRKGDKRLLKSGIKNDDNLDYKSDLAKKKKAKKREKLFGDRKDYFEKKTKKKRKLHMDDNQDSDSDKDSSSKIMEKKRKKDRKKLKLKDSTSSDDGTDFFKEQNKDLPSTSNILLRQDSVKSEDPDMSFLLCEENVPASPDDVNRMDESSGSDSDEQDAEIVMRPLPATYPLEGPSHSMNNRGIDTVLDNTPPTTPSSTESLLSSSPSHERDLNYPESTQSGHEGEPEVFHMNSSNRTVMRGSEEYRAATTLAFAVCKSVSEKPKDGARFSKSPSSDITPSTTKRKKKKKRIPRYSDLSSSKSPKHKSSFPRMSKDSFCEDSSGQSGPPSNSPPYGGISTLSFTRALPHRLSGHSEGLSRHNYVPLNEKDPEKRIAELQEKMADLRKQYLALRAEVIAIDHKRRRARKKAKDASGSSNTNNSQMHSEDGQNCS